MRRGAIRLGCTGAVVVGVLAFGLSACGGEDETISGSGYEFELPAEWKNGNELADEAADSAEEAIPGGPIGLSVDSLAVDAPVNGFSTNVNVLVEGSLATTVDSRQYAQLTRRTFSNPRLLSRMLPRNSRLIDGPSGLSATELDGEPAFTFDYELEFGARRLGQRLIGAVNDRTGYAITFTALADDFDSELGELSAIVASWHWAD